MKKISIIYIFVFGMFFLSFPFFARAEVISEISDSSGEAPGYIDILKARLSQFDSTSIQVEMELDITNLPFNNQSYRFYLDTKGDIGNDFLVSINSVSGSGIIHIWTLWLEDLNNPKNIYRIATPLFKNTQNQITLSGVIPLSYLENPAKIGWYANAQGNDGLDSIGKASLTLNSQISEGNFIIESSGAPYLINNKAIGLPTSQGINSALLSVKDKITNQLFSGSVEYVSTNPIITINSSNVVSTSQIKETGLLWARIKINSNFYILPQPLSILSNENIWSGRRVSFIIQNTADGGGSMNNVMTKYDLVRISDLASDKQKAWIGNVEPQGNSLLWLEINNSNQNQQNVLASSNALNMAVPFPMMHMGYWSISNASLPWVAIFHEFAHHYLGASKRFDQLLDRTPAYIESFPQVFSFLAGEQLYNTETNVYAKETLRNDLNGWRQGNIDPRYNAWMSAGAPINWLVNNVDPNYNITPNYTVVPGIMFSLADEYGWDKLEKFVKILFSSNERISAFDSGTLGTAFKNQRFNLSSTVVAAAWEVATGDRMFDRFTQTWHFPLDQNTYSIVLSELSKYIDNTCPTKGDFNCNGFEAYDISTMINIILKSNPTPEEKSKADMNNDNLVNSLDLNALITEVLK